MSLYACCCKTLLAIGLAGVLLSGCDSGPRLAPVQGRVTYDGKPVTAGKIMFYPEHGRPSLGSIAENGTYTLTNNVSGDGALIGEHKVTIESTKVHPGTTTDPKSQEEEIALSKKGYPPGKWLVAGKLDWLVPEKYSRRETSPLTATVENKSNIIDFDIAK
jgi:hypothetical protein